MKTKTESDSEPGYQMPDVSVGQMVLWRRGVDGDAVPAVVTSIGHSSVNLSAFNPSYGNLEPVDGVKHVSDPTCLPDLMEEIGNWDYTDEFKLLQETLELLGQKSV
jgi:hypothetical protein